MTPERIASVLTALAAVVVVLTRARMSKRDEAAGHLAIPRSLVNVHTVFGVLALAGWSTFLFSDAGGKLVGYAGLLCWWITTVAGLLILVRWVPARGRHASGPASDSWSEGPGLSVLAHVGLLVGSIVWTYLLVAGKLS